MYNDNYSTDGQLTNLLPTQINVPVQISVAEVRSENGKIRLAVKISGGHNPQFIWEEKIGDNWRYVFGANSSVFTIRNCKVDESRTFRAKVKGFGGEVLAISEYLRVVMK